MNIEILTKIHNIIENQPGTFDMMTWESTNEECGTIRCLAGWGIFFATGDPVFKMDVEAWAFTEHHKEFAEAHGVKALTHLEGGHRVYDVSDLGLAALDLPSELRPLFQARPEAVSEFVKRAVENGEEDALAFAQAHIEVLYGEFGAGAF